MVVNQMGIAWFTKSYSTLRLPDIPKIVQKNRYNLHVLLEKPPWKHGIFPAEVGASLACFLWDNPNFTQVLLYETQNDPKRPKMTGLMVLTMIFTTSTMMHRQCCLDNQSPIVGAVFPVLWVYVYIIYIYANYPKCNFSGKHWVLNRAFLKLFQHLQTHRKLSQLISQ